MRTEVQFLYRVYAELANNLVEFKWSKQHVWEDRAAVFEFVWGKDSRVAIDVFVGSSQRVSVHVVARDGQISPSLESALASAELPCRPVSGRGARFEVFNEECSVGLSDARGVIARLTSRIKEVRRAVEAVMPKVSTWIAGNGIAVEYVDREPRRNSRKLIVVLTSIRSDKRWLDFGGPFSGSMESIRARLLFLFDEQDGEYCYHMRLRGDRSVEKATVEFLLYYINTHGYDWSDVILCGMSKGGTAAIVLGSQLPGVSVVALAPQMRLGAYLASTRISIFRHMFGILPDAYSVAAVDSIVPECLKVIEAERRRVTIITAPKDENCFSFFAEPFVSSGLASSTDVVILEDTSIVDHFSALKFGLPVFLGLLTIGSVGVSCENIVGHELGVR